jgi:CubicO group peptidase (beta-lactamase class C family)
MDALLQGTFGRIEAILIARNGNLVLEEYFHGNIRDRAHSIQSITKSVNSLLVGRAIDEGLIGGVDEPVYEFFKDRPESRWVADEYPITLRHLLLMSSAIEWNETLPYSDPENSNTAMNASDDWIGYVLDRAQAGTPGEMSVYSSGQSMLLGGVVKNTTGRYSDEYAKDTLFRDLGVDHTMWFAAPDGTRHTGGGLSLTARDLLKIGETMRTGGIWDGRRVVSESWVEASITDRLPIPKEPDREPWEYGYQWWLPRYVVDGQPVELIAGLGYGGQVLGIVPSHGVVFVMNAGEWMDFKDRTLNHHQVVQEQILPTFIGVE